MSVHGAVYEGGALRLVGYLYAGAALQVKNSLSPENILIRKSCVCQECQTCRGPHWLLKSAVLATSNLQCVPQRILADLVSCKIYIAT